MADRSDEDSPRVSSQALPARLPVPGLHCGGEHGAVRRTSGGTGRAVTGPDMLAEIRRLAATLPTRVASALRVGPGVAELLLRLAPRRDDRHDVFGLPLGVALVADDSYAAGEWRLFDQFGGELRAGQVEALRGLPSDVQVVISPHLPDGVAAVVIAPSVVDPGEPGYLPVERRAVVIVAE